MKINGLPVFDAKEPISFSVTKRDIDRGGIKEPDSCAIALACRREFRSRDVRIHLTYSYLLEKDHWIRYRTPNCISREIIAFDRGGTFEPGEYTLLVPYKSDRIGVHAGLRRHGRYNKRIPLKNPIHITANVRTRPVFGSRMG
jgi:hypothetical protein